MILVKRGTGIDVIEVNPLPSSNMQKSVMGEEQITLSFEIPGFVDIRPGDYITYEGSTWTLNKLPQVKKLSSRLWQYTAVFQSTKYELAKAMYMLFDNTPTPLQGEFSLTGNANTFMALLVSNINRTSTSTWSLGQVIENTDYKTLTFSNEDCLSILARLAGEFETEYHVNNRVVHLKKISTSRAVNLQYGSTAYDIERSSVDSSDIVTRLYPFGSVKNLRPDYRGGNSPLRIPIAYLDKLENNVSLYGIIERAKTWDDIYPRLSSGGAGIVTSVGNEFTFSDSALDFNVNDYLLDGTPGKVHFTTGQCAGYDFEIKSYNNTTKSFVIAANVEDNDFTLPTGLIKPAVNDKYVLIDVIMPPEYEEAAEVELLAKAQQFLTENSTPKVNYKVTFSEIYARQNLQNIECGDTVGIIDNDLGINEQIRIIKLTKGITDYWNVQFDLANVVSSTRIERIEGSVSNIQNSVVVANQRINLNNLRAYQNTKELQELVFNVDGYFEPANIKPLSIETSMLSSGAKSQFFQLTSLLQPNYAGNSQLMHWSAGILTHFTIAETIREWTISAGSITITGSNTSIPLYIYARCFRTGTTGAIYLNSAAIKPDSDPTYFYFLIGVLHSPISGVRGISLNYGQTTINGGFIRTGVIQSIDGATYFNLNTGEFRGNFKFTSGESIQDYVSGIFAGVKVGGTNLFRNSASPLFNPNLPGTGTSVKITNEDEPFYRATPDAGKAVSLFGGASALTYVAGRDYVSSIYVRQASGSPVTFTYYNEGNHAVSSQNTVVQSGVWTRISTKPLQTAGAKNMILIAGTANVVVDYKKVKVENGTIPTDWSASPEDYDQQFIDIKSYADTVASGLQSQIDGVVDSWFFPYSPTASNEPAVSWNTAELKARHVGDTFTNTQDYVDDSTTPDAGKSWRWVESGGVYSWTQIADSDAVKALLEASQAKDIADGKRRVFTVQPTNDQAYDVGDMWVNATYSGLYSNDLLRCYTAKAAGVAFNISHWGLATKYTDDTTALLAAALAKYGGGKMLYRDPTFASGMNSIALYNNNGGTAVTLQRIARQSDNPSTSTHQVRIIFSGGSNGSSPGLGGFKFETPMSRPGAIYLIRIVAKIPTGYNLEATYNSIGTGGNHTWLTSRAGAATYQDYIVMIKCGISGTFSNFGYIYLEGAATPGIEWQVAYATIFDALDPEMKATEYLREALQGSTNITGGLLATNVLLMKNSLSEITGGMSGLSTDNVGMWTGGTYDNAINNLAKVILRKDGSGQLAGGKILWDMAGALNVGNFKIEGGAIIGYSSNKQKIKFHTGNIDALSSLAGLITTDPVRYAVNADEEFTNSTAAPFDYNFTANSIGEITVPANTQINLYFPNVSINPGSAGSVVSSTQFYRIKIGETLIGEYTSSTPTVVLTAGGTYKIEFVADYHITVEASATTSISVTTTTEGYLAYQIGVERFEIGQNGFYVFYSTTAYVYFRNDYGFEARFGNIGLRFITGQSNPQKMIGGTWSNL